MADEEIAHRCESSYKHHWETNPEDGGDGERRKKGGGGGEMRSYNGELIFYYFVTMT